MDLPKLLAVFPITKQRCNNVRCCKCKMQNSKCKIAGRRGRRPLRIEITGDIEMKYTKPSYEKEIVSTEDIILASVDLGNGVTLTEINEGEAQVGASALDVLGLR